MPPNKCLHKLSHTLWGYVRAGVAFERTMAYSLDPTPPKLIRAELASLDFALVHRGVDSRHFES